MRYTCHLLGMFALANEVAWEAPDGFVVQADLVAEAAVFAMILLHNATILVRGHRLDCQTRTRVDASLRRPTDREEGTRLCLAAWAGCGHTSACTEFRWRRQTSSCSLKCATRQSCCGPDGRSGRGTAKPSTR